MKNSIIFIIIFLIGLWGGYLWYDSLPKNDPPIIPVGPADDQTVETNPHYYQNKEWEIAFSYPEGWEVKENTFRAGSSLFNLTVEPKENLDLPRPIIINFAPTPWGQRLLEKMPYDDGSNKLVGGKAAYITETSDMGLPAMSYLIPVNSEFWIDIFGKTAYDAELQELLSSFEFLAEEE